MAAGSRSASRSGDASCACVQSAGGGWATEHEWVGDGVALEDRVRQGHSPIFLMVTQVKIPKWLDLARDAERGLDGVSGRTVWGAGRTALTQLFLRVNFDFR